MAFGLLVAHGIKADKRPRYMNDFDQLWNLPGECHKQWDSTRRGASGLMVWSTRITIWSFDLVRNVPECNIAAQQLSAI